MEIDGDVEIAGTMRLGDNVQANNIWWNVTGSFTTLDDTVLYGHIRSDGIINIGDSATVFGSLDSVFGTCTIGSNAIVTVNQEE